MCGGRWGLILGGVGGAVAGLGEGSGRARCGLICSVGGGVTDLGCVVARGQLAFLMGPADDGLRVALRLTLQGDALSLGHVLLGGPQSLHGGSELHVEGVAQLYRRLHVKVADEDACVPRLRVGDGES